MKPLYQYHNAIKRIILSLSSICLQACIAGPHIEFKPNPLIGEQVFPPSEREATLSKLSPSQLLSEGYVLLGTLYVVQDMDKGDADTSAVAIAEAARRGAEVVLVKADRKKRIDTRYRTGGCTKYNIVERQEWKPVYKTECDKKGYCTTREKERELKTIRERVCVSWEHIPYTVEIFETEIDLYRNVPTLSIKLKDHILLQVIQAGDMQRALELINTGAGNRITGKYGETPLTAAAAKGFTVVVKALVEGCAGADDTTKDGETALVLAARNGHVGTVDYLITKGARLAGGGGSSAVVAALMEGYDNIATNLIKLGAELPKQEADIILRYAAQKGRVNIMSIAIREGAHINGKSTGGYTALIAAAQYKKLEAAKVLLDFGADVNCKMIDNGYTPLFFAIENGDERMVALLMRHGADPKLRAGGVHGKTAFDAAKGNKRIIDILNKKVE